MRLQRTAFVKLSDLDLAIAKVGKVVFINNCYYLVAAISSRPMRFAPYSEVTVDLVPQAPGALSEFVPIADAEAFDEALSLDPDISILEKEKAVREFVGKDISQHPLIGEARASAQLAAKTPMDLYDDV